MNKILPISYLGNISYYSSLLNADKVLIEICGHYDKQTYRNRTVIYGANGRLNLVVPVKKGREGRRPVKEVEISYDQPWQRLHWKSLESAYRCSPYFEFYEHHLAPFYQKEEKFLVDLNLKLLDKTLELLQAEKLYNVTGTYEDAHAGYIDERNLFDPHRNNTDAQGLSPYTQVFENKQGFLPDLSILDLLFNCGPESLPYLNSPSSN